MKVEAISKDELEVTPDTKKIQRTSLEKSLVFEQAKLAEQQTRISALQAKIKLLDDFV